MITPDTTGSGRGHNRPESLEAIPPDAGQALVQLCWGSTLLFVISSALGLVGPGSFGPASAVVALLLFAVGCVVFLFAYGVAIGRSRFDAIGVGGLFFLAGSAPPPIRRSLLGSLGVQVVVAFGAASIAPFTEAAFGILTPVLGLGLCGLWAARHGWFQPQDTDWDREVPGG